MGDALTPELALSYLRELSAGPQAGVILDGAGARLAGPEALVAPAAVLAAALGEGEEGHARRPSGEVFVLRSAQLSVVVASGRAALPGLTRHDVRTVAADLAAAGAPGAASAALPGAASAALSGAAPGAASAHALPAAAPAHALPVAATDALLAAAQRGF